MTEKSIIEWCKDLDLENYKIINGIVNVMNGSVDLSNRNFS
jgi:hypothetical protein